jgi:protein CpxP
MKKTKIAIAVVAVVLALGATFAFAHGNGEHGRFGRHDMASRLAEKLNLTDAQKQQVADIKKGTRDENAAFFETARRTREEMRTAREANDTAKLDSLKATADSQRAQMKQIREAEMAKIVAILTPEQRTKFDALKAEREARHKDHKDND